MTDNIRELLGYGHTAGESGHNSDLSDESDVCGQLCPQSYTVTSPLQSDGQRGVGLPSLL